MCRCLDRSNAQCFHVGWRRREAVHHSLRPRSMSGFASALNLLGKCRAGLGELSGVDRSTFCGVVEIDSLRLRRCLRCLARCGRSGARCGGWRWSADRRRWRRSAPHQSVDQCGFRCCSTPWKVPTATPQVHLDKTLCNLQPRHPKLTAVTPQ